MNIERLNPWNWLSHNAQSSTSSDADHNSAKHLHSLSYLQQEVNHLIDDSLRSVGLTSHVFGQDLIQHRILFKPKLDVITVNEQYTVLLEVPGLKETELNVGINGDKLIISGEKENKLTQQKQHLYHNELSYGAFSRELTLPKDAVITLIQANLNEGVLSIIIPREPLDEAEMKHISINQTH